MIKYLHIFSSIKFVKGNKFTCILDFNTSSIYRLSNEQLSIIDDIKSKPLILDELNENQTKIIKMIVDSRLAMLTDVSVPSQSIPENFDTPEIFSNLILEFDGLKTHKDVDIIIEQIIECNIKHLEIRIYSSESIKTHTSDLLFSFIEKLKFSNVSSISLLLPQYYFTANKNRWINLSHVESRIFKIIIHSLSELIDDSVVKHSKILFLDQNLSSEKCCGVISLNYMVTNQSLYFESNQYNSCLNKKISIDKNGQLCNCPSMKLKFGHFRDEKFTHLLNQENFVKFWRIKKSEISKCKICEYRHCCSDCRAYLDEPSNDLSAPLKCGYDPFTGKWENWNSNSSKKQAIEIYALDEN